MLINGRRVLEFQDMIKALDVGHPKIAELKVTAVVCQCDSWCCRSVHVESKE